MIPLRDPRPTRRTPVITLALAAACTAVFAGELIVVAAGGDAGLAALVQTWGLVPSALAGAVGRLDLVSAPVAAIVTSTFLHAGWLHLLGNLLYLWIFGSRLEDRLGRPAFVLLYLAGCLTAAIAQTALDPSSAEPVIGASGAISAVLGAYLVLYPRARIQSLVFLGFFYQLLAVPAVLLLGFWFVLQLLDGVALLGDPGIAGGVAVFMHLGGFAGGLVMGLLVRLLDGRGTRAGRTRSPASPPRPVVG